MSWCVRRWLMGFIFFGSLILNGCALTPKDPQAQTQSDVLLSRQLDAIDAHLNKTPPQQRTVIYVGSAQHSQSLVFQRDVLLMKQRLLEINPDVQTILLSNQLESKQLNYPFANLSSLDTVFKRIGDWSKRRPIHLVTLISTHGNVDILSVNIGNAYWPAVRSANIKKWLDAIPQVPSALILSACYSGSFVPPLRGPQRVIMTAAAHNRNSFGCAYHDKNTYFLGNLLGEGWKPNQTWLENHQQMAAKVTQLEQINGLLASSPQIDVADKLGAQKVSDFVSGRLPE
jgi:hypothetical protein